MNRRSKAIAISTAVIGVVVMVAAGIAGKDRIREEWWIWRVNSSDAADSRTAELKMENFGHERRGKGTLRTLPFRSHDQTREPGWGTRVFDYAPLD